MSKPDDIDKYLDEEAGKGVVHVLDQRAYRAFLDIMKWAVEARIALEFCSVIHMPDKAIEGSKIQQYNLEIHAARAKQVLAKFPGQSGPAN